MAKKLRGCGGSQGSSRLGGQGWLVAVHAAAVARARCGWNSGTEADEEKNTSTAESMMAMMMRVASRWASRARE